MDLIVFLWLPQPDLDSKGVDALLSDALDDFEEVLRNYNFHYPIKDIAKTVCSLKFTVRNIKFDLLPAIDFIGNRDDPQLQQQLTLDAMVPNLSRYVYRFSSSLAFSTVDFMKKQSAFAHEMARLAKFWYKSACIEKHVSGASYFMELVAVHVVKQMTNHKHREAFQKFLQEMKNFERINIVFAEEFRHLKGHRMPSNESLPRVMDPSNPYNNLGNHFAGKIDVVAALKKHAQKTLENLQQLISTPDLEIFHSIDLFDPLLLNDVRVIKLTPKYNERGIRRLKDVDVRSQVSHRDRKKIEFIQLCFSAVVNKLEERYGPNNLDLVMEALVEIVTSKLKATTSIANKRMYAHEDFDASVWLKTEESGSIRLSFDLDSARIENDPIEKKKAAMQIYTRKTKAELKAKNLSTLHCFHIYVVWRSKRRSASAAQLPNEPKPFFIIFFLYGIIFTIYIRPFATNWDVNSIAAWHFQS